MLDLAEQRFSRLIVVSRAPSSDPKNAYWNCVCDCGKGRVVTSGQLRRGGTKACHDCTIAAQTKHGHRKKTQTRIYTAWMNMRQRCGNPAADNYSFYGGRGIAVCERWRDSFENFLADMGESPAGKSLDRIDNNKGYEPGNCRWATNKEQGNNRRTGRLITFQGETLTVSEWADKLGVRADVLFKRLRRAWPIERVLTEPPVKSAALSAGHGLTA